MRHALIAAPISTPIVAYAGCYEDVAAAHARARPLPVTPGRSALLEQIQRAEIARHEGDEEDCRSQPAEAVEVVGKVDAANHTPQQ